MITLVCNALSTGLSRCLSCKWYYDWISKAGIFAKFAVLFSGSDAIVTGSV